MADDVSITIGATLAGLTSALTDAQGVLSSFKSTVEGALSIAGISLFVDKMAELGVQVERTAATLGTSNEEVLQLQGLAKVTGTEMGSLSLGLERMYLNIQRSTRDAFNPAAQAMQVLGLRARDFIGVPTDQYIDRLHDAVSKFNPSMNLTTALMALGGRGIQAIIPLLTLQGAAWTELNNRIKEANGAIASAIPGMAETHANVGILQLSLQALGATVFSALKPAFDGIIKSLTDFIQWITKAVTAGGSLDKGMNALVFTGKLLASVFVSLIALAEGLGVALRALFDLAAGEIEDFDKNAAAAVTRFQAVGKQLKDELNTIWGSSARITIPGGGRDAGGMNAGAGAAAKEASKQAQLDFQIQMQNIKTLYETYAITEAQKTALEKKASTDRMNAEIAAGGNVVTAWKKNAAEIAKINADETKKVMSDWKKVADQFASDFSSALDSVLSGTKTWSQAMGEMVRKMIEQMIAEVVKLIAEWIVLDIVSGGTATLAGVAGQSGGFIGALAGAMKAEKGIWNVPSYQGGTPGVPFTGLAMLHPGEMVIPAGPAEAIRTGAAGVGGAPSVTLSVSAIDGPSFANWLRSGGGNQISRYITQAWQNNPSNRPGYTQ